MEDFKRCSRCHEIKSADCFRKYQSGNRAGQLQSYCNGCHLDSSRDWKHETGRQVPMRQAKGTGPFLGDIAERVLSMTFKNVIRMPYGHRGYDFICNKGFLIDVKSSCLHYYHRSSPRWSFDIRYNNIANYFIFLGFDSIESLNPMHVWIVPAYLVSSQSAKSIANVPTALKKWESFEKPLILITKCCNNMKQEM